MRKQILAIHTNGITLVDQEVATQHCDHSRTVFIKCGHFYTFAGEAADSEDCFEQCLNCRMVLRGDRTWGLTMNDSDERIPF